MITIVIIFPIVIAIPEILLSNSTYTEFISLIISVVTEVFVIAALSTAFKTLQIEAAVQKSL